MVGETVSHYRIVEALGGGGMGVVYKALDLRLNRFVALKFLPPELTKDPDANQRFRHEAQAASALDHPNIGTIHEIDESADHRTFLALAFYDGGTLKKRLEGGLLSVAAALDVAIQIAQGLSRAHQSHIVHRDIKPANVMLTSEGLVKIVDFGLAKLAGGPDVTRTGTTLGTVAYMSPEQARGDFVDTATDVWALGVTLYEMLAGQRPFGGKDDVAVLSAILEGAPRPLGELRGELPAGLQRIVARALSNDRAARYPSAAEMLIDLTACQQAMVRPASAPADLWQSLRRPMVAGPALALLFVAGVATAYAMRGTMRARWAREDAIPRIAQFVEADDYAAAFALATEVERVVADDPTLAALRPRFSADGSFQTDPAGAEVSYQSYGSADDVWTPLGRTPIEQLRLPRGTFKIRVQKEGFTPRLLATANPGLLLGAPRRGTPQIVVPLAPAGAVPDDMVSVPGGAFPIGLNAFNLLVQVDIPAFQIDRYEVTNAAFKAFIDKGGYGDEQYWRDLPIAGSSDAATWKAEARASVDATGRPGPAGWELGVFPAGQAEWPVTGVSWYEAAAYCRAQGKTLPTLFHWARAALPPVEIAFPLAPAIVPVSNFSGTELAAVGSHRGLGPWGTFDMAGNAREWVWNEAAADRRWILGGSATDLPYMFTVPDSIQPSDRSAGNGFRCARYTTALDERPDLLARVTTSTRNNRTAKAVSDEIYDVFTRQMAYAPSGAAALNARVEARDESQPDWILETVSFDAGYEEGRVTAQLFLPKHTPPPHQLVVLFPGITPFTSPGSSSNQPPLNFIVRAGRALLLPVWKGSAERWDPFLSLQGEDYLRTMRTRLFQWRQDLGRALDVAAARPDIDASRVAFYGASFGGSVAFPLTALEPRFRTAVLGPAGFAYMDLPPEADAINYVSHVTMPVLMLGGRFDFVIPLDTAQAPMFERLGTPPADKRHVVFDSGHNDFPRSEMIREVLGWLDRYLGPVPGSVATSAGRP